MKVSKNKVGGSQGAKPEGDFLSPYAHAHELSTPIDPHTHVLLCDVTSLCSTKRHCIGRSVAIRTVSALSGKGRAPPHVLSYGLSK